MRRDSNRQARDAGALSASLYGKKSKKIVSLKLYMSFI
jgi:ribosomal protein L25 (general stress protein Ctc)